MTYDMPDGTLYVTQTRDCAIYAEYSNRYAPGVDLQVYQLDGFTVAVVKGSGPEPETLIVTDTTTGMAYRADIAENERGQVCVTWAVMS